MILIQDLLFVIGGAAICIITLVIFTSLEKQRLEKERAGILKRPKWVESLWNWLSHDSTDARKDS